MKLRTLIIISLLLILAGVSACSGASSASGNAGAANGTQTPGSALTVDYENALPVEMQLALGTLKLANSPESIDA